MKIKLDRSSCTIVFEEDEKYFGKEIWIDGENALQRTFFCHGKSISFFIPVQNREYTHAVEKISEDEQEEVREYITEEAKKQGYTLIW